jgi:two-component system, LytTR family, response regulator
MERLITALLIEDDSQARNILQKFLEDEEKVFVVGSLDNTLQAEEIIMKHNPDVIFLDIHMPYESGISFATRLKESGDETLLVFTTAFGNYALDAFQLKPFDFLVKPFGMNEISTLLKKIEKHIECEELSITSVSSKVNQGKLKFRTNHGYLFLAPHEIFYVRSIRNYCELVLTSGEVEKVLSPISAISKQFIGSNFHMINRSLFINLSYIIRIDRKFKKCVMGSNKYEYEFELPITVKSLNFLENLNTVKLG